MNNRCGSGQTKVGSKKTGWTKMAPSCFKVFRSSRTTLQQLLLLATPNRLCCTIGYYQRLRGRHLPLKSSVRAASLQHCSEVPAECSALRVETTLSCSTVFSLLPIKCDRVSRSPNVSRVSRGEEEEEKKSGGGASSLSED